MAIEVTVPEMGESVLEATVSQWFKKEGEYVNVGDVLVELETDKVNVEVGAKGAGVLQQIKVQQGGDVKVGDVLGTIDEKAEQSQICASGRTGNKRKNSRRQEQAARSERKTGDCSRAKMDAATKQKEAPLATPVASRLARDKDVDISDIRAPAPKDA
jgi:2-oxoglutarate dehydrogenase E2 component (dihydrolipoamide succinyltransferase)